MIPDDSEESSLKCVVPEPKVNLRRRVPRRRTRLLRRYRA